MDTTGRPEADRPQRSGNQCRRHPATGAAPWRTAGVLLVTSLAAAPVAAQKWMLDASVSSQLLWTSDAEFGSAVGGRDTVLDLRPRISFLREGARLRLNGSAALSAAAHSNESQSDRVLPEADINARLEAVERLFFIEAGYRAVQSSENAFGARTEGASSNNTFTATQLRVSPYIEGNAGPDLRYRLRSDNSWSGDVGASEGAAVGTAGGYFGRHAASIEQDPRPFGWRVEAERSRTRYDDATQDPLSTDLARLSLTYLPGEDITAGVRAGYERNSFLANGGRQSIYGFEGKWQPSPRTTLSGFAERRFFGSAWRLGFDHRRPQLAWSIGLSRGINTAPQTLFELPATGDVIGLLDAMFTTRYPDPVERARVVQDFMASRGLPGTTLRPTNVYADRLSLVTSRSANLALIGVRNSLAFNVFANRTQDVSEAGPLATGSPLNNNNQYGAAVVFEHRLSAQTGLNVSADWSRIRALGNLPQDETTQRSLNLKVNVQAGPKTTTYLGGRYRELESNVVSSGKEGSVFIGVDHRF
jgi:uncharacterized protein (PEP-CTERM system associated)